mgnify:CR=1 FL=1
MARTTGGSGFKMRSGNTSTFKMMGSSPMLKDKQTASQYYDQGTNALQEMVNRGASSQELREYVVAHNAGTRGKKYKGGSADAKIDFRTVKTYRPEVKEEISTPRDGVEVVRPEKPVEEKKPTGWKVSLGNYNIGTGDKIKSVMSDEQLANLEEKKSREFKGL